MRSTATNGSASRRLAVEWLEQPEASPAVVALRTAVRPFFFAGRRYGASRKRGVLGVRRFEQARAFTLLELMVVIAIIGFLAAMTLPHVGGYNRANTVSSATRQLLDDVARARNRALANRSLVYMVFVPSYWNVFQSVQEAKDPTQIVTPQFTNLLGHQYMSYALLSARTVGDQPGQHFQHYLTEWQTLPSGVYIWPGQFDPQLPGVNIYTTNTFNGSTNWDVVYPFATNLFPFPSVNGPWMYLPYIGFTPQGTLLTPTNQYIVITRGSIFYAAATNGVYIEAPPSLVETPPGNETNNPCMIKIDWLTARASIVQNQFQ
jgi:prepilin-type N-terminal cleavage/methylation domain-containing protein